jgi:molybdenum cofactor biosynthesis enzyme
MTPNPAADRCFVCNQPIAENDYYERDNLGLRHVSPSKCAAALTAALAQAEEYDALCKRADAALNALTARLAAAEARTEAAEARIAVLCEEIDMKEGVLSALRTRAEAAEKERDELLKHCTALERESFERLIEHEKWQEREAIYRSQIEAGANLRPDGQTGGK